MRRRRRRRRRRSRRGRRSRRERRGGFTEPYGAATEVFLFSRSKKYN
jgi:hypothetical protein